MVINGQYWSIMVMKIDDDFPIAQPWGISQRPAMVDYRRVDLWG